MKNIILLLCLCFFSTQIFGQLKLVGIEQTTYAKAKTTEGDNDEEVGFHEFSAFLNIPFKLKNGKTILLNGVDYMQVRSTLYDSPFFEEDKINKNLHSLSYALTLIHKLSNNWTLLFRLKPTLASDFEAVIDNDDFFLLGTTMATRKFGAHITAGGGIAYTTQTGEPLWLPVIKFQFKNQKNNLNVLIPSRISYLRGLGEKKKIELGAKAAMNGGNFGVSLNQFRAADPATIDGLIYSRTNLGLLAKVKIYQVVSLELFGGYSTNRAFKFESNVINDPFEYNSEDGAFFSVGLSFSPKQKESN
ncbi:MAG: DUF6268 family outer membrane beta-barrel protein [Saprospiraceae bacterium]